MEKRKAKVENLQKSDFEKTVQGKTVSLWTLTNNQGLKMCVTNYGAKVVALYVSKNNGESVDVVTGYSSIDGYLNSGEIYFGAAIGRYGNRIANGKFTLNGIEYTLAQNNGPNSLHGGAGGFHAVVWDAKQIDESTLELTYISKDMEEGFPGTLSVKMIYQLTQNNEFLIEYYATTDKTTVCNLTNHSYFNLSGEGADTILDHQLQIHAEGYLPTDETAIPLGNIAQVENTPMDFRNKKEIGAHINDDFEALRFGNGYDHNYVLQYTKGQVLLAAIARSPVTGICMEVYTDQPGIQLYTGNYMDGSQIGKKGIAYKRRSAFCLEAQCFPDSPNRPEYPSTILNPGETYRQTTIHKFMVK